MLLPLSFLYGIAVWIRNWLFDKKILKHATFNFPIICVGNLAVGGTGKTPMVEYLVELLQPDYITATLSRGYKRKTKGFAIANNRTRAIDIGDEPMQFHQKFPELIVAVGEERLVAIPQILHERPDTQVIILDDAFQHRSVKAGLNILLTEYNNLYTQDQMMPCGELRDVRSSSTRAEIIVVTKCPVSLSEKDRRAVSEEISPLTHQTLFFTSIVYGHPYHLFDKSVMEITNASDVVLVCGIANPKPLMEHLTTHFPVYKLIRYPDHHIFTIDDLKEIRQSFEKIKSSNKIILTTEKDAVRLEKYEQELSSYPVYVLPIKHHFLFNESDTFNTVILNFIGSYSKIQPGELL